MSNITENNAVYDLAASPITFDFVHFAGLARLAFLKHTGDENFNLSIQYEKWRSVTRRDLALSEDEKVWRIYNLLLQVSMVTPQIIDVNVTQDPRKRNAYQAGTWFLSDDQNYLVRALVEATRSWGLEPHLFLAPSAAVARAERLISPGEKAVVIPIRKSIFDEQRNTELDLITHVASDLRAEGFSPIFIPDQETTSHNDSEELPGRLVPEAAYNIPLRLALHELATLSICSSSGPTAMLTLAKRKPNMIVIRPIIENSADSTAEKFEAQGFSVGSKQPLPWTAENQIYIWETSSQIDRVLAAVDELTKAGWL